MASLIYLKNPGIEEVPIEGQTFSIGRDPSNELQILHASLSRHHCHIKNRLSEFFLVDLNSRNGVKINGKKVSYHHLQDRDVITLGGVQIIFSSPRGTSMTAEEYEEVSEVLRSRRAEGGAGVITEQDVDEVISPSSPQAPTLEDVPAFEELMPVEEDADSEQETIVRNHDDFPDLPDLPMESRDPNEYLNGSDS